MKSRIPSSVRERTRIFQNMTYRNKKLEFLEELSDYLNILNDDIEQLTLQVSFLDNDGIEPTRIRLALLALTHTLYRAYLLMSQANIEDHPINQELQRIQLYREKLQRISLDTNHRPRLDTEVSTKIIRSALWKPE